MIIQVYFLLMVYFE